MKKKYLLLFIGILLLPINTLATAGRLRASSITNCNGQSYGNHGDGHWHRAIKEGEYWYADGEPLSGNPCAGNSSASSTTSNGNNDGQNSYSSNKNQQNNQNYVTAAKEEPIIVKSSDTSLKEIKINDESIDLNNLSYETDKDNIEIEAIATDEKAIVNYEKNLFLKKKKNKFSIIVTAEDGTKKEYEIVINKIVKSSDKNFKLFYKDEELKINFSDKTIEGFKVEYNTKDMKFTFSTKNKNTKIEITGNKELKIGNNNIQIKVIAEDGSNEIYSLKIERMSKTETAIINTIAIIIVVIIFVSPIYLIFKIKNKIKKIKEKNR